MLRVFEGRFGRLAVVDLAPDDPVEAHPDPAVVLRREAGQLRFLNPGELYVALDYERALVFSPSTEWLRASFPAVFEAAEGKPFPLATEAMTPRIRQLASTLAIEARNDQFLSPERLEFMLQELLLSILDAYLARRSPISLWKGSRFEDSRIRRAIELLRARPNKDMNIDRLANQVGLSRSRFYDLFELCTGFSPRTYLDLLCVEAAIARLAGGQGKIAEVSAELGFSAQSNFTRFFLLQVGVPPSHYRRSVNAQAAAEPQPPHASGGARPA
ncbi:MAG TPA: AraC family transcriptional regulator [Burkholderiales bacterium]|nr:AraC family transcriptional regulator [Burkholderiales bacterium]